MLQYVLSWPAFLAALVVFGFAPGALLRIIVLAFPSDDPRREELLAELRVVPRLERPFWVLEQLEVAIFEGVWGRFTWAATGRIIWRWHLDSGVELNRGNPSTFWIPSEMERKAIRSGDQVKLVFVIKEGLNGQRWGERMWVEVQKVGRRRIVGTLRNTPAFIPRMEPGQRIRFNSDNVIDLIPRDEVGVDLADDHIAA